MLFSQTLQRALISLVLSVFLALPALALDLGDAKSRGLVGENASGYIAAVKSSPEVDALVSQINAKRKARYQEIAKQNSISLEAVQVRAGQKAIKKTPAGQYVNPGGGCAFL